MRYGVPYQGSKNKIAQWVISNLPSGDTLIDLFAGGCSITHAAILSGKWNRIVANDIGDAPQLFMDAIHGKYANEKRWISREEFYRLKDSDAYVSLCWSFGNNRSNYLYAKEIEPWKKALHFARVHNDYSLFREFGIKTTGSGKDILENGSVYKEKYIKWWLSQQTESDMKKRLQSLERLQRLQRLQRLERLQEDYVKVQIPDDAIVYADPPYNGTDCTGYKCEFDHKAFEQWLEKVPFMVIVSEYKAPAGCVEIASIKKQSTMGNGNKGGCKTERLFVQEKFLNKYKNLLLLEHGEQLTMI